MIEFQEISISGEFTPSGGLRHDQCSMEWQLCFRGWIGTSKVLGLRLPIHLEAGPGSPISRLGTRAFELWLRCSRDSVTAVSCCAAVASPQQQVTQLLILKSVTAAAKLCAVLLAACCPLPQLLPLLPQLHRETTQNPVPSTLPQDSDKRIKAKDTIVVTLHGLLFKYRCNTC